MQRRSFPFRGLPSVRKFRLPTRLPAGPLARRSALPAHETPNAVGPNQVVPSAVAPSSVPPAPVPSSPESTATTPALASTAVTPVAVLERDDDQLDPITPDEEAVLEVEDEHFSRPRRRPVPSAGRARRARVMIALTAVGVLFAAAGAVCTVLSSWMLLRDRDANTFWPSTGNLASVLVVLTAGLQLGLWAAAEREWSGRRDFSFTFWLPVSAVARWISVFAAIWVTMAALHQMKAVSSDERVWWFALGGACGVVLGAVLAGVQRFRAEPAPLMKRSKRQAQRRASNR